MARHFWVTVRPFEGTTTTREALTYDAAMDIARREAERWKRGVVVTIESVPVRRGRETRKDFEGTATAGSWDHFIEARACSR